MYLGSLDCKHTPVRVDVIYIFRGLHVCLILQNLHRNKKKGYIRTMERVTFVQSIVLNERKCRLISGKSKQIACFSSFGVFRQEEEEE